MNPYLPTKQQLLRASKIKESYFYKNRIAFKSGALPILSGISNQREIKKSKNISLREEVDVKRSQSLSQAKSLRMSTSRKVKLKPVVLVKSPSTQKFEKTKEIDTLPHAAYIKRSNIFGRKNVSLHESISFNLTDVDKNRVRLKWYGMSSDFSSVLSIVRLGKKIGTGSFSKVYEGELMSNGNLVAVKVFDKQKSKKKSIEEEIEILRSLNHQNIVKLYLFHEDKTNVYLIMEHWGYVSLEKIFKSQIPRPEVMSICRQLLSALDYLWSKKIYHRDLKLSNIMYKDSRACVIDFGMAAIDKGLKEYLVCGTENYFSPEMLSYKGYNGFAVDIWCFGVILYALLTSEYPFGDKKDDKLRDNISRNEPEYKTINRSDVQILKKILTKRAEKRADITEVNQQFLS